MRTAAAAEPGTRFAVRLNEALTECPHFDEGWEDPDSRGRRMNATGQPSLEFALESLRFCLERPMVYGDREWGRRMTRAMDRLRHAFADHVDRLEAAGGP